MKSSRQGFTLIELLIVTVVIATLMGIVFRLAGAGGDNRARAITIERLQRLENALSGYYAAYGSYPPVPLQGRSRSIYKSVDSTGIQEIGEETSASFPGGGSAYNVWNSSVGSGGTTFGAQILAACKAQPVGVFFPYNKKNEDNKKMIREFSAHNDRKVQILDNIGSLDLDSEDWRKCPIFRFGLLSFLLPRYLFMLDGDKELYDHANKEGVRCGQWSANNQLPCRLDNGDQFDCWDDIQKYLNAGDHYVEGKRATTEASMIANITSQSVCARWMPNFEGIITGGREFYGVNTADNDRPYLVVGSNLIGAFSRNGYSSGSSGSLYILDGMTIRDGWGNEFFYYSEAPFQSYQIWSAGPDGRTFPVWYDRSKLSDSQRKIVREWTADDISGLNN